MVAAWANMKQIQPEREQEVDWQANPFDGVDSDELEIFEDEE